MADTPIFKLNSNPATSVTLPSFEKARSMVTSSNFILFEGRTKPTGFRSTSKHEEWTMVAVFGPNDRALAVSFMNMLDTAYGQPDGRLIMTPGGMQIGYADRIVEIHDYSEEIVRGTAMTRVTFTAMEVYS